MGNIFSIDGNIDSKKSYFIVSIDGNIGSGKSTLMKRLKEEYPELKFAKEPVDEWKKIRDKDNIDIIQKFYNNQQKWSFSFQMMAYISRISELRKICENNSDSIIFTERSTDTDKNVFCQMLYDNEQINEIDYQIYMKWYHEFNKETAIQKIIYVNTSPEKCLERIKKRDRSGEDTIPLEYLSNCKKYHDKWLDKIDPENILVLDGNIDIPDNVFNPEWKSKIEKFIGLNYE